MKETSATSGASSTKGFLYPRIHLTDVYSLVDIANGTLTASDDPSKHTGLAVYNVNPNFAGKVGLHTWDGTKWMNLKSDTIVEIKRDTLTVNVEKAYFTGLANDATSLLSIGVEGSVWKTVAFKTVPIDSKVSYNTSSGIFIVKATGVYDIYARYVYSGASAFSTAGISVHKKAVDQSTFSVLYQDKIDIAVGLTGGVRTISNTSVPLNAGDQLVFGLQTGGITLVIAGSSSALGIIREH